MRLLQETQEKGGGKRFKKVGRKKRRKNGTDRKLIVMGKVIGRSGNLSKQKKEGLRDNFVEETENCPT